MPKPRNKLEMSEKGVFLNGVEVTHCFSVEMKIDSPYRSEVTLRIGVGEVDVKHPIRQKESHP